jgi:RNA polymerase sigma factor (sigma-70 family)
LSGLRLLTDRDRHFGRFDERRYHASGCGTPRRGVSCGVSARRPLAADDCDIDLDLYAETLPTENEIDPEVLQNALGELSAESRSMLTMFYFEELSYREIAAATDIPIGTVMSRLSRAKEQLRRKLSDDLTGAEKSSTKNASGKNAASKPLVPVADE